MHVDEVQTISSGSARAVPGTVFKAVIDMRYHVSINDQERKAEAFQIGIAKSQSSKKFEHYFVRLNRVCFCNVLLGDNDQDKNIKIQVLMFSCQFYLTRFVS